FRSCSIAHRNLHSFPTRRSSDLEMETSAFLEGAILANYRFNKYKKSPDSIGLKSLSLHSEVMAKAKVDTINAIAGAVTFARDLRSEEHTSELQSRENLVCRLLLE